MRGPGPPAAASLAPLVLAILAAATACRAERPPAAAAPRIARGAAAVPGQADLSALSDAVAQRPADPEAHRALGNALALAARDGEALAHLERAVELGRNDPRFGNDYRRVCMRAGEYQRAIDFLRRQTDARPDDTALRLNLALAYVDNMPTAGLGIVGQGMLSNRSIGELNRVLESEPRSWIAMYGRAMNHLHWPRALRHASRAAEDFRACLDLQKDVAPGAIRPHHLLPYLGLGDAHVKNGDIAAARRVWRDAATLFPDDPRLARRLSLEDPALEQFVEQERGLARPIDTDLSFVWAP